MIRILIYDDEKQQCDILENLLLACMNEKAKIDQADTIDKALDCLESTVYNIVFMDIVLDSDLNGIDLAKTVQKKYPQTRLVYITGYIKYCEEIFTTSPDALILKPFTESNVKRALDIVQHKQKSSDCICIAVGNRSIDNISLEYITYLETVSRKLTFFDTQARAVYEFYDIKMTDVIEKLPSYFIQCHKSFCVNLKYAKKLERFKFTLENSREVPVSQSRFQETKSSYLKFLEETL